MPMIPIVTAHVQGFDAPDHGFAPGRPNPEGCCDGRRFSVVEEECLVRRLRPILMQSGAPPRAFPVGSPKGGRVGLEVGAARSR